MGAMDTPALLVEGLSKTYRPGDRPAVDGLTFTLPMGQTWGLLGGNGAGKSTTIAMLLGLLVPSAGRVVALGHDMATDRFAALARMNFSSPYIALPHRLTVEENLRVYAHLYACRRRNGASPRWWRSSPSAISRSGPRGSCPPGRRPAWRWPRR